MTTNTTLDVEESTDMNMSIDRAERIRQRVYELYEAHGQEAGHDIDDWLRAEAEIEGTEASPEQLSA